MRFARMGARIRRRLRLEDQYSNATPGQVRVLIFLPKSAKRIPQPAIRGEIVKKIAYGVIKKPL